MTQPTQKEIIGHIKEHFGISGEQVLQIMRTPTHPYDLRDRFAMMTISSVLAPNPVTGRSALVGDFEACSITAYKMADAMLEARSVE